MQFDAVGIDVAYAGTQKCLGVPPGLAPISFSEKAMRRIGFIKAIRSARPR